MGLGRPAPRAPIMRARVGVISGRSATSRPPLSVNAKSWPAISGPDLAVKSSSPSSTGPSISSKPAARDAPRQADSIQRRTARSSGKKSRKPGSVWKRMARHRSPRISPSHPARAPSNRRREALPWRGFGFRGASRALQRREWRLGRSALRGLCARSRARPGELAAALRPAARPGGGGARAGARAGQRERPRPDRAGERRGEPDRSRRGHHGPGRRLPQPRPPDREARSARPEPRRAPAARPRHVRPRRLGPEPAHPVRQLPGPARGHAARADREPAPHLLPHLRRGVHGDPRQGAARLADRAHGAAREPARAHDRGAAAHPDPDHGGGALRAVPAQALPGRVPLLARRRRGADPADGRALRGRLGARRRGHRDRHGAPRAPERDGARDGHALPRDHGRLPAVADAGERVGRGRREVPPRLLGRPPHAGRQVTPSVAVPEPESPGVDQPGGGGRGRGEAAAARRRRRHPGDPRCSSTATRRSPARASCTRRSRCRSSRATAPAARST